MAIVVGIDSSTQSTKAEARDLDTGEVLATGRAAHRSTAPPVSEQDPADWWTALVGAVGQAVATLGQRRDDIVALSVAGQQHGLVLVDRHDRVLRPAKLWNDTTSAAEAAELVAALGPARWAEGCASVPVAAFTITKLAWVLRHEPEVAAQVARVALPHDHLTWRLTERHVTDRGDASGTGWFDPAAGRYRADLLEALDRFGPSPGGAGWLDRLPRVLGPFEAAGELTAAAAAELGLPSGVVVGPGTGDNMAAALGLGLAPGDVALSLGTSGTVYAVSDTPSADPSGAVAGFADATGRFLPLVCTLNATKVTDTMAAWLGTDPAGLAELALDATRTGRADRPGPVLVPYFDGERTPNRPEAAGSLHGLRTTTTRAELALAAHDGVLCGLLDGLDALRAAGVSADGRLHLIGGGARSGAYRQRAADLHGEAVAVPTADETVATGAALQAALVYRLGSRPAPSDPEATAASVAAAWRLGDGIDVEPRNDATAVRGAYAAARDR